MITPEEHKEPLIIIELKNGKRIWTSKTKQSKDEDFIECDSTTINGNLIKYKIKKSNIELISTQRKSNLDLENPEDESE